jgi:hypothetical protein
MLTVVGTRVPAQCYDIVARTHQPRDEIATDVACCSNDHHSHSTLLQFSSVLRRANGLKS